MQNPAFLRNLIGFWRGCPIFKEKPQWVSAGFFLEAKPRNFETVEVTVTEVTEVTGVIIWIICIVWITGARFRRPGAVRAPVCGGAAPRVGQPGVGMKK